MKLEFTCKGYYAKTKKETTYTMDIEIADNYLEYLHGLLENGELNSNHYNYIINIAIRELSWFRHIVFKEVIAINVKKSYTYLVMLEWQTEDDSGLDYYLYHNYSAAKNKYKNLITDENDADISWVGSEVFDENGEVNEGYHFDCREETGEEQNLCWRVADLNNSNRFSIITLTKVEII